MIHADPHPQAGQVVKLAGVMADPRNMIVNGAEYRLEDWWDRVYGRSWMHSQGNPAAMQYAMRSGFGGGPTDDEVVYGHIDGIEHLVHVSELDVDEPAGDV